MDGTAPSTQISAGSQTGGALQNAPDQVTEVELRESLQSLGLSFKGGALLVTGSDPLPNVDGVLALWQRSMGAASPETAQKAFMGLWVTTSHERASDEELTLKNRIYTAKFREFPDDIVREVARTWSERPDGRWFPSLKDITDVLRAKLKRRHALGDALKAWGSRDDIQQRIKMIRFDLTRADLGHQVAGTDVPEFVAGLQGKSLAAVMPRYREWADKRISDLEGLL